MKRRLAVLLIVGLLGPELLAGCGGGQDAAPDTLENEAQAEDAVSLAEDFAGAKKAEDLTSEDW